ncbi:hypothetical protein ABI_09580 [Asticcacaulis biprosthecium C19]|uniref:Uncharacterized protein n=1 Tax=Asticcacaulis biprosthecium C19 TaxID=715226 RepID=F4QGR9_9CAUL|nr:hypothetical protein ABI_09580 [Asticcacaulis biprosthecium C19]
MAKGAINVPHQPPTVDGMLPKMCCKEYEPNCFIKSASIPMQHSGLKRIE